MCSSDLQNDSQNSSMYNERLNGINSTPGWQDVAAPFVGAAAGLAGAAMTGGGSLAMGAGGLGGYRPANGNTGFTGRNNPWANIQF